MKNLWDDTKAATCNTDLALRVYTSNLLGRSDELVLHGGGNTSVKIREQGEEILYVKGSGWDLVSIKAEGFAPVRLSTLLEMAKLESLSDTDMVSGQKAAMTNPKAPNPSVEAILHALIPFKFVDHTHADAIVTISNSKEGETLIAELFPDYLIVPYVMPGFILAQTIYKMTQDFDWRACKGIILHHHGIFTFDDDAKTSYDKMIEAVTVAENFLERKATLSYRDDEPKATLETDALKELIEKAKGHEIVMEIDQSPLALTYASQPRLKAFATRGVLTPEHILRTKRVPLVVEDHDIAGAIAEYIADYIAYFKRHATDEIMLNPTPNYAVVKDYGVVLFGKNKKEASILKDIIEHTMKAVLSADQLGGYQSIDEEESFKMEYWELEQAKLKAK